VIVHLSFLDLSAAAQDALYTLLPLAIAGFFTASIFALHCFLGAFSGRDKCSKQDHPFSKGVSR